MANNKAFKVKNGIDLAEFNAITGETWVQIQVYDTSTDSDGGRWRYRTKNTSWYNEGEKTSGNTLRSARKEFPAVAIVAINETKLYIYDADYPDLPVWRGSGNGATDAMGYALDGGQTVKMKNGLLLAGQRDQDGVGDYDGLRAVDFIRDEGFWTWNDLNNPKYIWGPQGITASSAGYDIVGFPFLIRDGATILDAEIYEIDIMVRAGAPIDPDTGLPKPTVGMATESGVTLILESGETVNVTSSGPDGTKAEQLRFTAQEELCVVTKTNYDARYDEIGFLQFLPSVDRNEYQWGWDESYRGAWSNDSGGALSLGRATSQYRYVDKGIPYGDNRLAAESAYFGMMLLDRNRARPDRGMTCNIANNYNTGWMHGSGSRTEIAIANTNDDTNLTGSGELLPSTDFSTGWNYNGSGVSNGSGWSIASGEATHSGATGGDIYAEVSVTAGQTYVFALEIDATGDTSLYNVSFGFRSSTNSSYYASKTQTNLTADANNYVEVSWYAGFTGTVIARIFSDDNITLRNVSVKNAIQNRTDRNVYDASGGVMINGTITSTPVATGADLCAYTDFSDSTNYLQAPYTSELDIGNGSMYVSLWHYHEDATLNDTIYFVGRTGGTGSHWQVGAAGSDSSYLWIMDGSIKARTVANSIQTQQWTHLCFVYTGKRTIIYVNGEYKTSSTGISGSLSSPGAVVQVPLATSAGDGNDHLALVRVGTTAPSDEQIKTMYEDEKHLFKENAKCVSADYDVRSFAYDKITDTLWLGHDTAQEGWRGIELVETYSSDAQSTMSAHNGLVAGD